MQQIDSMNYVAVAGLALAALVIAVLVVLIAIPSTRRGKVNASILLVALISGMANGCAAQSSPRPAESMLQVDSMNYVAVAGLVLAALLIALLVVLIAIPSTRRGGLIAATVLVAIAGAMLVVSTTSKSISTTSRSTQTPPRAADGPTDKSLTTMAESEQTFEPQVRPPMVSRAAVIGLGVLLLLGGALLASNEKTRSIAMQVIAGLGLVAAVVAIGAFFVALPDAAPISRHAADRTASVVKPKSPESEIVAVDHAASATSAPRPDWVDQPPLQTNNEYRVHVSSGLYKDRSDCDQSLELAIKRAADQFVESLEEGGSQIVSIDAAALRNRLHEPDDYWLEVDTARSVGPMLQLHALLKLDTGEFRQKLREAHVSLRLRYTAAGALLVLAVIGTAFGYLKIDLATAGAYRARLQLAAATMILIAAAGAMAVRWSL